MERRGTGLIPQKDSRFTSGATFDKVTRTDMEKLRRYAIDFALGRKATIRDLELILRMRLRTITLENERETYTYGTRQAIIYKEPGGEFPQDGVVVLGIDLAKLKSLPERPGASDQGF